MQCKAPITSSSKAAGNIYETANSQLLRKLYFSLIYIDIIIVYSNDYLLSNRVTIFHYCY